VTHNLISGNVAQQSGGGLMVVSAGGTSSSAYIANNTITGNQVDFTAFPDPGDIKFAQEPQAASDCSGRYCPEPIDLQPVFQMRQPKAAKGIGAGILLVHVSSTLESNIIEGNICSGDCYGGAVTLAGSSSAVLTNNLIAGNQANQGAAVYASPDSLASRLIHNTLVDNLGASGVSLLGGEGLLVNNIISGHEIGVWAGEGVTTTLVNTLLDNTLDISGTLEVSGTLTGDPLFYDPDKGDYRLVQSSPAVDAGAPAGVETDFEGQARDEDAPDIGYDELELFADFKLSLAPLAEQVRWGGTASYTIRLDYTGTSAPCSAVLAFTAPQGMELDSFTSDLTTDQADDGSLEWALSGMQPGGSYTFTLVFQVDAAIPIGSSLPASATVSSDGLQVIHPEDDQATAVVEIFGYGQFLPVISR
jgi:hypothetical protein